MSCRKSLQDNYNGAARGTILSVRIVFDTSSLITALRSNRGAAAEVLRLVLSGDLMILMDYKIAAEYRDVALRPEHLAASRQTSRKILTLIEALEELAEPVQVSIKPRPLSSDPNDDMILDVAINGRADALVTQNAKHFKRPGNQYGILVLSPVELLTALRKGEM
ncbi:putative toxin-antitoxin system toxin component, PIN family [Granulicella arctica]|uniref:putative toxin-antitoxin system toxin component, PIN family n=1 Tax=Granulicella arctica TaxID=940613 RepID=UPI0021DFCE05|nr:putative toxin-antitoxin system toxin component, PIN family [Granulicella arctica]